MATVQKIDAMNGAQSALAHYGSVAELEADCLVTPMEDQQNQWLRQSFEQNQGGITWYGVPGPEDVKRILREGYPEGAALVDQVYDTVAAKLPRAVDFRRHRVRGDQGDSLDIHAVNRGAIDKAWETAKRKAKHGTGLIRIAVDVCGNCGMSADRLKWRGVAALALCRAMTKAGYSVEIVAGMVTANSMSARGLYNCVTVTVKPRYAAVDTATLAATVCLPGFFRYSGFAALVRNGDALGYKVSSSLGMPTKLESVLPVPEKIAQVVAPETINNQEQAIAWVKETIELLQGSTLDKERQGR